MKVDCAGGVRYPRDLPVILKADHQLATIGVSHGCERLSNIPRNGSRVPLLGTPTAGPVVGGFPFEDLTLLNAGPAI